MLFYIYCAYNIPQILQGLYILPSDNKTMLEMCRYGLECHYFKMGKCRYIHPPQSFVQVERCQNGSECYYLKKAKCRYYHSPQSGAFKCPSGHFSTKLQLTGKPCKICRNLVQGYGLECTECQHYVCRKCTPIHHSQLCNGTQLVPIHKMKTCRKCNKLISGTGMYYCPLKCNYFICKPCYELEISNPPPVKKQYVEKSKYLNEVDNNDLGFISEPKKEQEKY